MRAGTAAQLALEFRIGQRFIGRHILGLERAAVVDDDAGAGREGEPGIGMQMRRNARLQQF
jgi:hypothetical protein